MPPPGVIAPPAGAIQVPAAPPGAIGVQGVGPPNTIAPYPPGAGTTTSVLTPTLKPAPLPAPVSDSNETSK
jgi:hypothetical protein